MTALRQLWVFVRLLGVAQTRRVGPAGKPRLGGGAAVTNLLLRLMILAWVCQQGFVLGSAAALRPAARTSATGLLMATVALSGLGAVFTLQIQNRAAVKLRYLTDPAILTPLPLFFSTRLFLTLLQGSLLPILGAATLLGAAPELRARAPLALAGLGMELAVVGMLLGVAAVTALTAWLPGHRVRAALRLCNWVTAFAVVGTLAGLLFGLIDRPLPLPGLAVLAGPLLPDRGGSLALLALGLGGVGGSAVLLAAFLEGRGFDALPGDSPVAQRRGDGRVDLARAQRLALRREEGRVVVGLGVTLIAGGAGIWGLTRTLGQPGHTHRPSLPLDQLLPGGIVYLGYTYLVSLAARQAQRDLRARPLLAALPLTPADTLSSKRSALEPAGLVLLGALALGLVAVPSAELAGRSAVGAAVVGLLVWISPAMAFLTNGLGSGRSQANMPRLEFLLLALPLFNALAAPSPTAALPSLGLLTLLGFEANRAAALRVRWLDDAGDELERETPVWRALLVFAAFAAVQSLLALGFQALPIDAGWRLGWPYLLAGVALLALTLANRGGVAAPRWVPRPVWTVGLGTLLGAGTGALGLLYLKLLEQAGVDLPESSELAPGKGLIFFAAVTILAAPLCEELFFRGWLQTAIGEELPARWKELAFVIAAFAFAAIHPPLSFPPVFALGLVAGVLYQRTGGLLSGMAAHAAHNAVAVLLASH